MSRVNEVVSFHHSCRRFTDKVIIVTGGASGIGAACAARFVSEGAKVVLADVNRDLGELTAKELGHDHATFVPCDVASAADWSVLRERTLAVHGRVDVLHSNAFVQISAPAHELDEAAWDHMLAVNLKASYLGTKALIDLLCDARGSIVLTSSVNAFVGRPGRPAYAAAKAGLGALGRQLAVEYGPEVRVNTIVPGAIMTPPWQDVPASHRHSSASATAAKRLGSPDEVAAAVAFLASDDASYITGVELTVDGGWTIVKSA